MKNPQVPTAISRVFQSFQRLAPVRSLFIAAALCLAGQVNAAAPDLTAGGVPNDNDQWNLGPTGMAGWCYKNGYETPNARQFQVVSVAAGSPAAGIMAVNDVILGASGTGADPVNFTQDARVAFGNAITDAEARTPATLKVLRWRAGVTSIVSLTLETLGAYSATAPYNCPKSAAILEKGIQWIMNNNTIDSYATRFTALPLLAANDPTNPNNAARQAKAAAEARLLILSPATIALYTSGKSMAKDDKPWLVGPRLIALSEYYLKTGDPDPNVMASIRAYAHCIASGQSMFGTCGHYFSAPGYRNNQVNGSYNIGYGPINAAAIPCYIGLTLAKKCGLNDPEITAAIERAGTFYAQYTHIGCPNYGEHLAIEVHDDNGKAGMSALAFHFEGDRLDSAKFFAMSSTAGAIAERDTGHQGSIFAYIYSPLGANVGGPDAMAYYFRETKWMYELARRWDGSFVYNTFSNYGVEVDAIQGGPSYLMAVPMLLTYATPLRQTYLTGRDQNPANWITPAEMPEVSAASAHIYNAPSRTTAELLSDTSSWSPRVRRSAARELKLRTADHASVLPILHATAANASATIDARAGACAAMCEIGNSSSVPVLISLATHSNYVLRYAASLAIRYMPAAANRPHVDAIMQACITNEKPLLPLDTEDPMQTVCGNLCWALFAPHGIFYYYDLVGINRELLYSSMRVCASTAQADVRNGLQAIYPRLTPTDVDNLGDVFVNIAYENSPAGQGVQLAREPAMSFLQSKGKAEGVPLAIRYTEEYYGLDTRGLKVLAGYAGSSNSVTPNPDVERFCEILIASGVQYGIPEAQALLAAIAADTSPKVLTPFKSIDWIIPDHATFNLPKKSTVLRVHSKNRSNPTSTYTWRKLRGAGTVSFSPNGTSAAKDATVVFDGIPGQYLFEVTMSDSHGLTEVSKTVTVTLRDSGGTLPPNSPPTTSNQSLTIAQGTPTQVILTGVDPEGYALNYTVTSNPTKGSLSGTAPYLVYTPAANATGSDSISFKVEDGEGQFATATVSITVNTASPVGLALYEPFNYAAGNLHGKSGDSEIGLTGTWTTGASITTESPSLAYGTLPASGNRVRSVSMNSPGGSRPISPAALAGRGLLDNGATLWFSVVMGGYGGYEGSGNLFQLALGNNGISYTFPNSYNIPNDGSIPGSGLGVKLQNKGVYASQFAATGAPLTGAYDNTVTGGIVNDNQRLVVGKITWGAANDTIEIYLPEQDMILPAKPTSVLMANVDQSTFDTLTFSRGANVLLDEIRFGATLQSVLQGTVAMSPDVTAPTPNPMTFAVAPAPNCSTSITMTAAPAFDGMGVEYLFTCTAGGGSSSGWQTSNVFTDTGLTPGVSYSYTVKARDQHPALNETTASPAASAIIPALVTVPGLNDLPESLAQTLITNASLSVGTVTQSGAYSMTVPAGHVLSQSPIDGASVAYGSAVNLVISIGQDPVLPVLTPVNIVDNKNGEQIELGTPITFTLTFNKDINAATLNAGDFINIGDAPVTIGAITETSPGVVTVTVTPNGTVAGILRFAVAAGAVIEDTLGNDLNTISAVIDDTVISILPIQPKIQTFTGNSSGASDNWNTVLNWNVNSGPIPTGTDSVIIPSNKQVSSSSTATPLYEGNLTIGSGAILQAGYNVSHINIFNCLGTPGKTTIAMGDGSQFFFRGNFSPVMPAIVLQGNAEIIMGSSTSAGSDPVFNYPVTGPYTLTLSGKGDSIANLNVANNFEQLRLSTQYGSLFTVNANTAGSLGGDVTVMADYTTGGKGANLVFSAANAMADTATLTLYGNSGSLVTLNASDTIAGLKLNGVKQLPGTYNSGNSSWITGAGALTVNGAAMAYWNPSGGPSGTWDDSIIWNDQANLAGTDNPWTPGQIAAFNAAGTYSVTLGGTKEIGGFAVSNGTVTLSGGGLNLSSEAPFNVASGATLAVNTIIEQNTIGLGLHKSGAGTLNLLGENTFTGPVAIGAGTLSIDNIANAGVPSALGQYPDPGTGGLLLAGGTLRYTGGNATVNRGFTFSGSSGIVINNAGSSLTLADVETAGPGTLTASGGAGSSLALGKIKIVQSNNITLNPTTTTMTVASVEGYSSYPLNATITLGGSSTGNVVTGSIYASVFTGSAYQQGTALVKTGTGEWRLAGAFTAGSVVNSNVTVNEGTLILAGNNTYTGYTNLNNLAKLVLDFSATNTSKIDTIILSGGTLELKGGSHIEVVGNTTLNAGPTAFITRNGGSAKLRMNSITRSAQSSISFLDGTVADTDRTNTNGILGGYATIGTDWAVNSTNGADGPITALSSYDTWTNSGGASTANYLLTSGYTLAGALAANSLKISNIGLNQTLNLGANNLTITSTSATTLGGVLYTGGAFGSYTINGTGGLLASSTTGELVVNTHEGTLIVNAPLVTSGATAGVLVKSGNGSLVLGGASVYTGTTRVNSGKLFVNGSLSNVGANLQVDPGATLGGTGTVGRNVTIADGGKLEFNLSTSAASHLPLTRTSGKTFGFSGSSVLTITASAGATPGLYTLITGGNNITGSAPATVILPPGWTADPPVISTNQLRINITNVVAPPNALPLWSGNPISQGNANEDTLYSVTLVNNAYDSNGDPLTFAKVSGPAWLDVAANGSLSGTPTNSNVGANSFIVSVTDSIGAPVEATLNITVNNTNDAPVWSNNPLVGPDATEDAAYSQNMATAASDVDAGATLTFAKVSGPAWLNVAANGIISGTPSNADVGLNAFTVSVSDGIAAPIETTLQITVINTNDAPAWTSNPVVGANATEDSVYSGSLTGSAVDVDAGASLSFTKISGPAWLNVASNGSLSGVPINSNVGANGFTVSVTDGIAAAVNATLNITVINTNDAPVAVAQSVSTEKEAALPITLAGTDVDGNSLTYSIVSPPAHGTLSGTAPNITYTSAASYIGPDSFTFKVNDGTVDSAVATVSITVTRTNETPVAVAQSVTTDEDAALPITLTGTDADNDPLTYSIVTQPANGTLSGTAPNVTYMPTANYNGSDSFTFKVNDTLEDSPVATVSITVTSVNDVPVFIANPIILAGGTENIGYSGQSLAGSATDVESGSLTYLKVSGPSWLTVASNGALSGTPPNGSGGTNSFVVRATDGASSTTDATLEIAISFGDRIWADSYITSLDVLAPTTIISSLNFPSFLDGPLTGSSNLTLTGYVGSQSSFINNAGNTFNGNIIANFGTFRVAGSPFASNGGFTAPGMNSSDTITINRAGTLTIDDNVTGGYSANRFGTAGNRPAVNLTGGTINLSGLNNASSSVQTLGALTASSGASTVNVSRNSTGNPTLTFASLAQSSGSFLTFNGTNLGTGTSDARITFVSGPAMSNNIIAGARYFTGAAGTSEFATYGASGVTAFTAFDVFAANDINGATSTQNARMTGAFTPVALAADTTVNSLNINGNGGTWNMTNKLTVASGMILRNGTSAAIDISSGTLTAGTGSAVDLTLITAQQNMSMSGTAVIADNGAGAITLVKAGGNTLTLNNGANNTYTGGSYVVDGALTTGTTANRRYLGTGKTTANAATLTLGAIGATSNSSGADYTAVNGAQINIATAAYTSADTFDIKANSVISGGIGSGTGLNSLDRTSNITLATNAIIGHSTAPAAALNLTLGTIKNLGTSADLYYGLASDHNTAASQITIGTGTAFKGISSVSAGGRAWGLGTINVVTGTTDVYFQGLPSPTAAPILVIFGNGASAGGPTVSLADTGTLNVNILGSVQVNDTAAVFGDTSANKNVNFVVTAGSSLSFSAATGMGSGNGIASATVKNGGTLHINNGAAINGAVTIEAGGMFTQSQATLTGTGTFTHTAGSILNLTNAASVSGATQALGTVAGTIVRMGVNPTSGTTSGGMTDFDARLNDAAIYQLTAGITFTAAASATDSLLTLNSSGGIGGILTNNLANQGTSGAVGTIKLGANGGLLAATTNTTLTLGEDLSGGALTIGTTAIIDGAPKLGTVILSAANTHSGGTTINAGTLQMNNATSLGSSSGSLTVNTGGTLNMVGFSPTVGNLTGTGGVISGTSGTRSLTIGQGDGTGGNFQGSIANGTGGTTALTKTGTGTITLSGTNTYTGATAINAGKLFINGNQSSASGNVTVAANATLGGSGTIGGSTTIAANGKLEFNLSTFPASHDRLDIASGKSFTFSGASTLTITSSGGLAPGLYTLITGGNNITGVVPATLNLPFGMAATVSISGNSLVLNVTTAEVDTTAPTVVSITDDQGGASIVTNTTVNYTVTFNEDIDAATVTPADFGNAGTASGVINSATETSPGVFLVSVTPSSEGSLQLRINAGAVLSDLAGNPLNTTAAILDDTTITVTPVNSAPVANTQSVATDEDTALPVTLTATDADNNPLTYTVLTQPANGTLSGTAPNLTYTPATNFNGADSFTFRANDGFANSNTATVSITVNPVNDAPVAVAQSVGANEDTALPITLTGTDVENSALTFTIVSPPSNGTLSGTAPNVTYTPASNFNGADSFTFRVNDGTANSTNATVSINVTPINDAPVAVTQSVTTDEDTALPITLAGTDAENSTLTYSIIAQPTNGTLSGTAPNMTYTPASNHSGADSFTFKVNDGTVDSTIATVSITVTAVNDAPVATAQSVTTEEDTALPMTLAGTDVENSTLTFVIVTPPSNGTLSGTAPNLTYTPSENSNGTDSFTFTVNDGTVDSAIATISLTVNAVNDAPVAVVQNVTTDEDTALPITLAGTDVENSTLTYTIVGQPANGTLSGTAPNLTYTPSENFNGADNFTFTVNDGTVDSATATVSITVNAVNDVPVAFAQNVTTDEDTALPITLSGTDIENSALTYTIVASPANGTLSGSASNFTYTPAANFNSTDSFTFTVNDGTVDSATATVYITVNAVNDVPVAVAQSVTTDEDTALPVTLTGTDVENSTLTYTIVTSPTNGTLSGTAPNLTYTPSANYNGADSFAFLVNDGTVDSAVATVSITVNAVNDAPVAVAQSVTTDEDTALPITMSGTDVENSTLTFTVVSPPANGTLSGTAPYVIYTPSSNFNGTDSLTFSVNDGTVDSATATVSITVTAVNDAPVATAQSVATDEDTTLPITLAGTDVENSALTYTIVSQPANGTLSGTAPNVTYTPAANFNGTDSLTFTVNDGTVDSASATVSISVTPINDAPVAAAQSVTTDEDTALPITLSGTDIENSALTYTIVAQPTNGTLSGTAPNVIYTPVANFNGTDSLTFKVNDGTVDSATATVSITVTAVNDAPVAAVQSVTTAEDTALPITLAGTDAENSTLTFTVLIQPANGTLSGTAPNMTYTPSENSNGADSFTFTVNDGTVDSAVATVSITVNAVNDAPVAVAQNVSTAEDTALPITLAGTDAENSALTYAIVAQPANGTLSGTAPNVTYTPTADFNGTVSFTFTVNDGTVDSTTATVSITVTSINDAPVFATNPTVLAAGSENVAYIGQTLAGRASDVDAGDTLTYSKISGPGWLSVAANGALSGTPPFGSTGVNSFVVRVTDAASATASATLEINIATTPLIWDANGTTASQTNGSGAWLAANLWWNGTSNQSWASNASPTFGGPNTAGGAVTLASPTTVGAITFNQFTGTYTLGTAGTAITLNNGIVKQATSGIATIISPLVIGAQQTWTNHSANALNISASTNNNGNLLVIDGSGTTNFAVSTAHIISGSGGITMNGPGRLTLGGNQVPIHTYAGTTTLNNGVTMISNNNLGSGNLTMNGGVVEGYWTQNFIRALGSGAGQVQINGGASGFSLNGNTAMSVILGNNAANEAVWGSAHFNPSILVLQSQYAQSTSSLTFQNKMDLNGTNRTIQVSGGTTGAASATLSGIIRNSTGTAALIKTGAGRLNLNAANTYNGGTTLQEGTIQLGNTTGLGSTSGELTVNGGLLNINNNNITIGNLTGTSGIIANNGNAARTLTIGSGNGDGGIYQGVIANRTSGNSGTINLTKTGTGTITLGGANIYTGATAINAGKLCINGNQSSASGSVTVASAATLGGTGTLGGNTTIASGGKLEFDISTPAASHDHLDISSGRSFAFSGASVLTITSSSGAEPGIYTLISGGNNITGTTPAVVNLPVGWEATVSISGNSLLLNVTSTGSAQMRMAALAPSSSEGDTTSPGTTTSGVSGGGTTSATTSTDPTTQTTEAGLPLPWVTTDIGTGMVAGSATQSAGTFTQAGSGVIGSTADKLRFTYQALTDDGEIIAKISNLQNTGNAARVGVMIRDSLAANSMEIFMGMTGSNAYRWDRRATTGGSTSSSSSGTGTVPNTWVRLVRSGNTITAYKSTDGTSWTSVGSTTNTAFASTCYIGLADGSGNDTTLNTSQFSNVSVTP